MNCPLCNKLMKSNPYSSGFNHKTTKHSFVIYNNEYAIEYFWNKKRFYIGSIVYDDDMMSSYKNHLILGDYKSFNNLNKWEDAEAVFNKLKVFQ